MTWNWQQPDWPNFAWDSHRLQAAEREFLLGGGVLLGTVSHLNDEERTGLAVEAMSTEALTTSEIEGEMLDRPSVQASIQKELGLAADNRRARPQELGIAEMMVDLYHTPAAPLAHETLFHWHELIMKGLGAVDVGRYRTGDEPMQVVSGRIDKPNVHFEAPPSKRVAAEMDRFLSWFHQTGPDGARPVSALTRAGIAHLWFESIHPFEDGNGRVGRAIAEKALVQGLGQPIVTALAATILIHRKAYYEALEAANRRNEITEWLAWFAGAAIEANRRTLAVAEFLVDKTRLLDRLSRQLNERQVKAVLRMFQEGPSGFEGGLSAGKYTSITGASASTATRDLAELVEMGALTRVGELKYARYHLAVPLRPVRRVVIGKLGELLEE